MNKMIIKSSGFILGNTNYYSGFCLLENDNKIIGNSNPSMEYFFHSFMKKYTVHLHFTPCNYYLYSNNLLEKIRDFKLKYLVIDYLEPGKELAENIKKSYTNEDIVFLMNHGIILTSDTIEEILDNFEYVYKFFSDKPFDKYNINREIYEKNGLTKIINEYTRFVTNIKCCSPDIAVFCKNLKTINNLSEISDTTDIFNYKNKTYLMANDMTNYYSIKEILDEYFKIDDSVSILTEINNIDKLLNKEEEKFRKNL